MTTRHGVDLNAGAVQDRQIHAPEERRGPILAVRPDGAGWSRLDPRERAIGHEAGEQHGCPEPIELIRVAGRQQQTRRRPAPSRRRAGRRARASAGTGAGAERYQRLIPVRSSSRSSIFNSQSSTAVIGWTKKQPDSRYPPRRTERASSVWTAGGTCDGAARRDEQTQPAGAGCEHRPAARLHESAAGQGEQGKVHRVPNRDVGPLSHFPGLSRAASGPPSDLMPEATSDALSAAPSGVVCVPASAKRAATLSGPSVS